METKETPSDFSTAAPSVATRKRGWSGEAILGFLGLLGYCALVLWRASRPGSEMLVLDLLNEEVEPPLLVAALVCVIVRLTCRQSVPNLLANRTAHEPKGATIYSAFQRKYEQRTTLVSAIVSLASALVLTSVGYVIGKDFVIGNAAEIFSRSLLGGALIWTLWWGVVVSTILRDVVPTIEVYVDPLHADHCGGLSRYIDCSLYGTLPVVIVGSLLMSWLLLSLLDTEYDDRAFIEYCVVLILMLIPIGWVSLAPLLGAKQVLSRKKDQALERFSRLPGREEDAIAAFNSCRHAAEHVRTISLWRSSWAGPLLLLLSAHVLDLAKWSAKLSGSFHIP
jgi:hypothetical protein